MRILKSKIGIAASFLLIGFFVADFAIFSSRVEQNIEEENLLLKAQRKNEQVDVIVVLTGAQGRIREALWLLEQGRSTHLFVSGVEGDATVDSILLANQRSDFSQELKKKIFLDSVSQNTEQNAEEIVKALKKNSWNSFLLVTSSYHLPRAKELIRKELIKNDLPDAIMRSHSVESHNFESHNWWTKNTGWLLMLKEYLKMKWAQLRL
jgi:uncharacterized SAM-binding protein YcdF (DUF218 family)